MEDGDPGMGTGRPWVRRDLDVVPRGNSRRLHEPQPISNQLTGVGIPHQAGRYRPVV